MGYVPNILNALGNIPRYKVVELEKEGIKRAQGHILSLSSKKIKITPDLILEVHKIGFGFIFPDWAGKFRVEDVTVGEYEPPHYSRISELVKTLCDDLEERLKYLPPQEDEEKYLAEIIGLLA